MEIIDYPNYLIYEDGLVFSQKYNKFLKEQDNRDGYKRICLCKDGKQKHFLIHRLIAIHYIPNPDNLKEVDHINRDKSDNRLENLRWVTRSENEQNKGIRCDNTSGEKYISYDIANNIWKYSKTIDGKTTQKNFKTFEEAVQYKHSNQIVHPQTRIGIVE